MTIETNRDQASTLLRVALEDNELGYEVDALEHARDAVTFLEGVAFEKGMARLNEKFDRSVREMETADLEEFLQSGGIK